MGITEKEKRVLNAVDKATDEIFDFAKQAQKKPELGYKETETGKLVQKELEKMGITCQTGLALTGVRGRIGTEGGFHVCVIGEMDAVLNSGHPDADAKTGAIHACGHHGQLAAMLGAAYGFAKTGIIEKLGGAVDFFAVPAEEYIDLDYRRRLKKDGKIRFLSGKQQLIYEGAFDDVDAVIMVHAQPDMPEAGVCVHGKNLGFVEKQITFRGVPAHAGEPFNGINALNAAALAILGIHANREKFRDEDKIRIHPIITKGGDAVNIVPSEVCMDSYVRGANMEAIKKASADTDRAIYGAAQIVGAAAEIKTTAGYLPLIQDRTLGEVFCGAARELLPEDRIFEDIDSVGSSDIGDLSRLLPCIQPTVGGYRGALHSDEFCVADAKAAYIVPAKIIALTVMRLLENNAEIGREVKRQFRPSMTKEEYINNLENI